MIIWGSKYLVKSLKRFTDAAIRCNQCGQSQPFEYKTGQRYFTLFFIPIFPFGAKSNLMECPTCKSRYEASPA